MQHLTAHSLTEAVFLTAEMEPSRWLLTGRISFLFYFPLPREQTASGRGSAVSGRALGFKRRGETERGVAIKKKKEKENSNSHALALRREIIRSQSDGPLDENKHIMRRLLIHSHLRCIDSPPLRCQAALPSPPLPPHPSPAASASLILN